LALKLQYIDIFSANLVHLCNNVSPISPPKFYFHKPAIVEELTTNLRGSLFIGTPCINSQ